MWLRRKNWRDSEPHLLLLSKFFDGESPSKYVNSEDWESVLGETPIKAIRRLHDESMLQSASLPRLLNYKFTVAELKRMLKENGQKISGNKAQLIQRLIENSSLNLRDIVKTTTVYECTSQGTAIAQKYLDEQRDRRVLIERDTMSSLGKREFGRAVRLMSQYEAAQVFPRGMGIDWSSFDAKSKVQSLKVIFGEPPEILNGLNPSRLETIRIAAGMMELWGVNDTKHWVPNDFDTGIRLDADVAARMLCFHAAHIKRINEYRDSELQGFVTGIEISGIEDGRHCDKCSAISGKKYTLGQIPELPLAKCESEVGCRCMAIPTTVID
jgi:hypothetical protein